MVPRWLMAFISCLFSLNIWASFDEAQFARALGLQEVLEGHPYNFLGVSTMYADESLSRQMLVMRDVPAQLEEMRIIKSKNYLILEVPKTDKSYISMALVGISEDEIRGQFKTSSVWKTLLNELVPIKKAYSFECEVLGLPGLNGFRAVQDFFSGPIGRRSLDCMGEVLDGAWDATGGIVVKIGQGIGNLIDNPKAFWDEKVGQMRNLANFIQTIDLKMKTDFPSLNTLPIDIKVSFICGMVGGLGGSFLSSLLMGSAPLMTTLSMISTFLLRTVELVPVFDTLKRTGQYGQMPKGFFSKLVKAKNPEVILTKLIHFAAQNRSDLILATMKAY